MQNADQRIYQILADQDKPEQNKQQTQNNSSFFVHVAFKAIPIVAMLLREMLTGLFSQIAVIELVLLFVVIDFWLTKNIIGRRMIGMRWGFQQNEFGDEKFQFQGRVNEQYVNSLSSKMFWLVLIIYTLIPAVFIVFGILSVSFIFRLKLDELLLWVCILIGGGANVFFFWRASGGVNNRRSELFSKLGNDFINKMGAATVVSYL